MDNTFFSRFTPREPKFFPLLKGIVTIIKSASELMLEFVEKGNAENAAEYYRKIKEEERKGDAISNKIFDELNSTFITPFSFSSLPTLIILHSFPNVNTLITIFLKLFRFLRWQ